MEEKKIIKVVVLGPESTGKSTLCEQLATHYNTIWVKEYAREYLLKNGTEYTYENLFEIAEGQIRLEREAIEEMTDDSGQLTGNPQPATRNPKLLFLDTDLHVIKVWSEFVFNKCDNRILTAISKADDDLYLLCNTDLPWVKDELREYPDLESREKLFQFYKQEMIEQKKPWAIISGNDEERLKMAIDVMDGFTKSISRKGAKV